ncbi:MAG: hypothetical protein AAGG57_11045 [Pseudomonadota bacterium]
MSKPIDEPSADTPVEKGRTSKVEDLLNSSNWEERLIAARAQREKVLAEKGQKPTSEHLQTTVELPQLPKSVIPPQAPRPSSALDALADRLSQDEPSPQVVPSRRKPAPLVAERRFAPASAARYSDASTMSWRNRAALIALSCGVCLGFGVAIGNGVGADQEVAIAAPPTPLAPAPAQNVPDAGEPPVPEQVTLPDDLPLPERVASTDLDWPAVEAREAEPTLEQSTSAEAPPLPLFEFEPEMGENLAETLAALVTPADAFRLHIYAPDSVAQDKLDREVAGLEGTGLPIVDVQRVGLRISEPHIRFYNSEDARVANALARDLEIEVRDFSQQHSGSLGRIELWMDGSSNRQPAVRRTSRTRSSGPTPLQEWRRIRNRVLSALR